MWNNNNGSGNFCSYLFKSLSILFIGFSAYAIWQYPLKPGLIAGGLLIYGSILWRYPNSWLLIVPAALPVFDLAPWTGRFFFDEFDILILVTLGVRYWNSPNKNRLSNISTPIRILLYLFIMCLSCSAIVGLQPFSPVDFNSFSNYLSTYNALRVVKGFAWAFFSLPLLEEDLQNQSVVRDLFIPGMLIGLAFAGVAILWERQVFPGLINFNSDFRVGATFSGMHTGGAYIDAYLAAAVPFSIGCFFLYRQTSVRLLGGILLCIGIYSQLVTYSRIDYLAFFISLLIVAVGLVSSFISLRQFTVLLGIVILTGSAVTGFFMNSAFIQKRFSTTAMDAEGRLNHWGNAVRMMNPNLLTDLIGMGIGSYPRYYAMRSSEHEAPSNYWFQVEKDNTYLSLPSGGFLYFDQKVPLQPNSQYILEMDLRSDNDKARLSSSVCEKSLMHSYRCQWFVQEIELKSEWEHHEIIFNSGKVSEGNPYYQRRPVSLSLLNGLSGTIINIDNIQLLDENKNDLIRNGNFSNGNDFWFFTADNHLPWHIKNLWVHLFFEQGMAGLLLFNLLLFLSIINLSKKAFSQDLEALLLLASLFGLLVVGFVDSLFDFPRITFLFFLLMFMGMLRTRDEGERQEIGGQRLGKAN